MLCVILQDNVTASHLVMTLLRTRHHLTTLLGAVVDWYLLTRCVTQELAGRLLHVPGGAGGLVVVSALLLPLLSLRTLSHQGIVTVKESVVLNNLFVRDAAVLLIVLVTNLPTSNEQNIKYPISYLYIVLHSIQDYYYASHSPLQ